MTDAVRCKTCPFCEPTGQGTRGGEPVDIGICRRDPPRLSVANAGAFPPVALDTEWCGQHPDFKPQRKKARSNA